MSEYIIKSRFQKRRPAHGESPFSELVLLDSTSETVSMGSVGGASLKGLELFVSTEGEPRGEPSMVFRCSGAATAALGSLALRS